MDNGPFKTIRLRPHVLQYVICLMPSMLMCGLFFFLCRLRNFPFTELCLALSLFILCYIIFRIMYLSCMEYVITSEQLIFHHGVLVRSTDYMELYRVVDYQQNSTLAQQLLGLKTISILSGDRNMPRLDLIGMRERIDVVGEIRIRVEWNKTRKGIYEITNR